MQLDGRREWGWKFRACFWFGQTVLAAFVLLIGAATVGAVTFAVSPTVGGYVHPARFPPGFFLVVSLVAALLLFRQVDALVDEKRVQ